MTINGIDDTTDHRLSLGHILPFILVLLFFPCDPIWGDDFSGQKSDFTPLPQDQREAGKIPRVSALTDTRGWAPANTMKLVDAEACYDLARDQYVIAAVFTVWNPWFHQQGDAAYLLHIEADEGSARYGQLVYAHPLGGARRIDSIDCATDDLGRIYVAHDRYGDDSVWYRLEGIEKSGPYRIPGREAGCHPYSYLPRIALSSGGSPILLAAFQGFSYRGYAGSESNTCQMCVQAFDSDNGEARSPGDQVWFDHSDFEHYDVEWNGNDSFLVALSYQADHYLLGVRYYSATGEFLEHHEIQMFPDEQIADFPHRVELVHSPAATRTQGPTALITDRGSVYWLNEEGTRIGFYPHHGETNVIACRYFGGNYITHSFHSLYRLDRSIFGFSRILVNTIHRHWPLRPGGARDEYSLLNGYLPIACDAGSGVIDEPELFLVTANPFQPRIYWHFEKQH